MEFASSALLSSDGSRDTWVSSQHFRRFVQCGTRCGCTAVVPKRREITESVFVMQMAGRCSPLKGLERLIIKNSRYSDVEIGDKATALATRL